LLVTRRARWWAAGLALVIAVTVALGLAISPHADAGPAPLCQPRNLAASAALAGGAVTVTPEPGSLDASHLAQISFVGVPAAEIVEVHAVGSRSGAHGGRLLAYSQGDGGSFVPQAPFAEGETVTVSAVLRRDGRRMPFRWRFTVADVDSVSRSLETPPPAAPPAKASELQHFLSRPELKPPVVDVTKDTGTHVPGDIFLAPYAGPGQYGPMILDSSGHLIWFKAIPHGERAADLRVQEYDGRPVLSWWQDPLLYGGRRDAGVVIADSSYRDVQIVRAGNGYQPDLHAFQITPQNTGVMTVYDAIRCNLRPYGGPREGAVADTLLQEVDLSTGLVRYEWHALDHVSLADSYMPLGHTATAKSPWDYFHINVADREGSNLLVDSRNTWAAYYIDAHTGRVLWRLGGKHSSFHLGPGAHPAFQHDSRLGPDNTLTFFDNGGTPWVHPQSRVIVLRLNTKDMTVSLVSSFHHSTPPLRVASQGDFQPLPDGNWLVGWGQEPYFSEFSPEGHLLFDAHMPAHYQSFTALKFPWSATPAGSPRLALRGGANGGTVAYASWNGATTLASWGLLGGSSPSALTPLATAPRVGFETAISTSTSPRYLAVQALGAGGEVLATSATVTR
jgi:Arylsulfotransferase (ASST)